MKNGTSFSRLLSSSALAVMALTITQEPKHL